MTLDAPFERWTHRVARGERSLVYPDGCRDVLIVRPPGGRVAVRLTEFDLRPRIAALAAGTELVGFRLRPGATIGAPTLRAIAAEPEATEAILHNDLFVSPDADLAIRALTEPDSKTGRVARDLGVSVRSLQRLFARLDLPTPEYWRLLARARRAVGLLAEPVPLADLAAGCGYSDQAHMAREMLRWFGRTPRQVRRDAALLRVLRQPALGNWTGEQISTR